MEFINETDMPAALFRTSLEDETRMLGVVVAKSTYRFDTQGRIARDLETPLPVSKVPLDTGFGPLPGDHIPFKHGIDVFALGYACAPRGLPVSAMWVSLTVGSLSRQVAVYGDRYWQRGGTAWTPPNSFEFMPITWEHAYGGKALREGNEIPHTYNPHGKGYVLDATDAEGVGLPNVEDRDCLIRTWQDRPLPISFAPLPKDSQFFADDMLDVDYRTGHAQFRRLSFNTAHPKLRPEGLLATDWLELNGMSPDGIMRFPLPCEPLSVHVSLENRHHTFPVWTDTVGVLAPERRFFLIHRCRFTYSYVREEIRVTRLRRAQ